MSTQPPHLNSESNPAEPPAKPKVIENPLVLLLHKHIKSRGVSSLTMARALSEDGAEGDCRLIDQMLNGEGFDKNLFDFLTLYLEIPNDQIEKAHYDRIVWISGRSEQKFRRKRSHSFAELGPYVYALSQPNVSAAALGIEAGGDGFLYHSIPPEILGNRGRPELDAILRWITTEIAPQFDPSLFAGFLVHLQPEEVRFYSREGELIGIGNAAKPSPNGTKEFFFN
jgi:hypothetical protein